MYLTGMQALVRLPLQQRLRDAAAGLNTGGYISGYRGSPLGRYDMELWAAEKTLKAANIVFRSGLNEDLAATAIWGAQYVGTFPGAKVDGVFGIWYGKGPGVDRSGDALRHANLAGTSPKGGVLCLAGDDHGAKSSTVANFSDPIFIAVGMPVLYPSNTQELLDYGLHGIAMSRFSGCWVGMKVVTDVVEGGGSVYVAADAPVIQVPKPPSEAKGPFGAGYHIRGFDMPLAQEDRLYNHKHAAVLAYARCNGLNQITINPPSARIGIVAAGKAWQDLAQALENLDIDDGRAESIGLRLLKIGMVWPLDPEIVREFAEGLETVIVVEEKRPILEDQLRVILYGSTPTPRLVGKHTGGNVVDRNRAAVAFPNAAEISPGLVTKVIVEVLGAALPTGCTSAVSPPNPMPAASPMRTPSFCSGCPHNRSTIVPDGSRALAGIGCHTMAWLANPQQTTTTSHMGAEGTLWLGQQPFTAEKHVFANMGDGTYAHSGFLAIRQAIAAKVPITYKLLFNGFVSMTGGQSIEGAQTPAQILSSLAGEGVRKMAVVTDDPERYHGVELPRGVAVHPRTELEALQREFREYPDVSVILYDQPCAAERRRLRKRGKWSDPDRRTFINSAVCEGCGDCGVASNCMSVEPLETELGRKRHINQSSCNKDYSCIEGFCPSFVSVRGAMLRKRGTSREGTLDSLWTGVLPNPNIMTLDRTFSVLIGGVGGTGVVTIGQTLAMAAHVQGYFSSNLDVTGLAQKYGAVSSHVRIAPKPEMLHATRIAAGEADTMIGCDLIVAAADEAISRLSPARSHAIICTDLIPTSDFARNPDWHVDASELIGRLRGVLGESALLIEGQRLAQRLMGDPIAANMFLLGAAWQLGWIPLSIEAIERAIELNGVAISMNKEAFTWGRRAAHDMPAVERFVEAKQLAPVIGMTPRLDRSVDGIIAHRSSHLVAHTNEALAARYRKFVERVRTAESAVGSSEFLTRAVAHNYHRLLATKDEWEVARLFSHPEFKATLDAEFEGNYRLSFYIGAWPFARVNAKSGKVVKAEAGAWLMTAFKWMSRLRGLRGSIIDPFRHTAERRLERRLLSQYESDMELVLAALSARTLPIASSLASLPQSIRGYGHVKAAQAAAASVKRDKLLAELAAASLPEVKAGGS